MSIEPFKLFVTQTVDIGFRSNDGPKTLEAKLNLMYLQLSFLIRITESTGRQLGSGLHSVPGLITLHPFSVFGVHTNLGLIHLRLTGFGQQCLVIFLHEQSKIIQGN